MLKTVRQYFTLFFLLGIMTLAVLMLSACGGSSGGGSEDDGVDSIPTGMNHEITYDLAKAAPPSAVGTRVNTLFGADHKDLQIAFNDAGDGMAVWTVITGGIVETEKVVYSTYDPLTSSWSTEQPLFVRTNVSPPATAITLAASSSGFAISWEISSVYSVTDENVQVWDDYNYAKVYENGAWSEAMLLNASNDISFLRRSIVSSNGSSFLFVWQENGAMLSREWSNGKMSAPSVVMSMGSGYFEDNELVSNGSSYMFKVEHGLTSSFSARHMTVVQYQSGSWSSPVTTETNAGNIYRSAIASDNSGYMMTWDQDSTSYYRHFNNGSWSAMSEITNGPGSTHQLVSNGNSYALSWVISGNLNVKLFSGGNWGNTETPDAINGNIGTIAVAGSASGYVYSLRVQDTLSSDFDLYLFTYDGGATGNEVLLESDSYDISDHAIAFDNGKTFIGWRQFDGNDMQLKTAIYSGTTVSAATSLLSQAQHSAGVTSGKVGSTLGGIRVAAWGQTYFDTTGAERRAAFARVDDNTGSYDAAVHLRDYSDIRDVVVVGETVIVLLDVIGGLSAIEYRNGSWVNLTSFNGGYTYDWKSYVLNDKLFLFWTTNSDGYVAVYDSANGSWSSPTAIKTSGLSGSYYKFASNGEDVLVIWQEWQSVTPNDLIKSRFYDSSTGLWSTEQTLDAYDAYYGNLQRNIIDTASGFNVTWVRADDETQASTNSLYNSQCNSAGVCAAAETLMAGFDTLYNVYTAANDNGVMAVVKDSSSNYKYFTHNGSNWSGITDFAITGNGLVKLYGDGSDFIAFVNKDADLTNYDDDDVVDYYRYSAGSWSSGERIIGLNEAIYINNFKVFDLSGELILTWISYKPDTFYQEYNLYSTSWNGSQWSAVEQINTGKFDASKYHVDITNSQLRLSWIQAHESESDPSAPMLWELIK